MTNLEWLEQVEQERLNWKCSELTYAIGPQLVAVVKAADALSYSLVGNRFAIPGDKSFGLMVKVNEALSDLEIAITAARNGMTDAK